MSYRMSSLLSRWVRPGAHSAWWRSNTAEHADSAPDGRTSIDGKSISRMVESVWKAQRLVPVGVVAVCWMLWGCAWRPGLYLWAAAALAMSAYRVYVVLMYRRNVQGHGTARQEGFIAHFGFTWPLSAFVWGTGSFLHFDHAPAEVQFAYWSLLGGMGLASVAHFAAHYGTTRRYINALLGPAMAAVVFGTVYRHGIGAPVELFLPCASIALFWHLLLRIGRRMKDLQQTNIQWRQSNEQLIASLLEQTREAKDAVETKNRFIASAAHDLAQPVHALSLYADDLRANPEGLHETLPKILQATQAINALFTSLFDLAKLDANAIQPRWQNVALEPLVRSLVEQFAPVAKAKGLDLRLRSAPIFAQTDPVMLTRIVGNFISNAVRHTDTGGILVALRQKKDAIVIQVWDTGPGIAPIHQELIFKEFYRITKHHGTEEGFGLGLSIVARLGAALGHPIEVRSHVNLGSVFSVSVLAPRPQADPWSAQDVMPESDFSRPSV